MENNLMDSTKYGEIRRLLTIVHTPAPTPEAQERRTQAIAELKAMEQATVLSGLVALLDELPEEQIYTAVEAIFQVSGQQGLPYVLPLLNAPDPHLRWWVIDLLEYYPESRDPVAIQPLIERLHHDPDVAVRTHSAHVLGMMGSLDAIPALKGAQQDREYDEMGYSAGSNASKSIDTLLMDWAVDQVRSLTTSRYEVVLPSMLQLTGEITLLFDLERYYQTLPRGALRGTVAPFCISTSHPPPFLMTVTCSWAEITICRAFAFHRQDEKWSIGIVRLPDLIPQGD